MAKDFKKNMGGDKPAGGLSTLLSETSEEPTKRGRPKTSTKEITKTSQEGTKENETRATFIVEEDLLEKSKAIAYWDRVLIKNVVGTALREYVDKYERERGKIKPIPKK